MFILKDPAHAIFFDRAFRLKLLFLLVQVRGELFRHFVVGGVLCNFFLASSILRIEEGLVILVDETEFPVVVESREISGDRLPLQFHPVGIVLEPFTVLLRLLFLDELLRVAEPLLMFGSFQFLVRIRLRLEHHLFPA